jgi:nitrite reductase/ring-hydroxylating ferredoxin subunit
MDYRVSVTRDSCRRRAADRCLQTALDGYDAWKIVRDEELSKVEAVETSESVVTNGECTYPNCPYDGTTWVGKKLLCPSHAKEYRAFLKETEGE